MIKHPVRFKQKQQKDTSNLKIQSEQNSYAYALLTGKN